MMMTLARPRTTTHMEVQLQKIAKMKRVVLSTIPIGDLLRKVLKQKRMMVMSVTAVVTRTTPEIL